MGQLLQVAHVIGVHTSWLRQKRCMCLVDTSDFTSCSQSGGADDCQAEKVYASGRPEDRYHRWSSWKMWTTRLTGRGGLYDARPCPKANATGGNAGVYTTHGQAAKCKRLTSREGVHDTLSHRGKYTTGGQTRRGKRLTSR